MPEFRRRRLLLAPTCNLPVELVERRDGNLDCVEPTGLGAAHRQAVDLDHAGVIGRHGEREHQTFGSRSADLHVSRIRFRLAGISLAFDARHRLYA